MSEREIKSTENFVEERFNKYKEMTDIPVELEFEYRAIAQLEIQYEQQSILNPDHVKTRAELLKMRNEIKRNLPFQPKTKVMYIDVIYQPANKSDTVNLYVDNEIIYIRGNYNFDDFACIIKNIIKSKSVTDVRIDTHGFGKGVQESLENMGVKTTELKTVKS